MARALASAGYDAIFSYAGRTESPVAQPLPLRIGGFGGASGMVEYLRAERITHLIDATHPFAATISKNAILACIETKIPLIGLERAPWVAGPQDRWISAPDIAGAVAALPEGGRVFLAIGKQNLAPFALKQNFYLLRLVDAPESLALPDAAAVIARGPFTEAGDLELLRAHQITHIVSKNSGGTGAYAKLAAARTLGLTVIMIARPQAGARDILSTVPEVLAWLHQARLGV